MKKTNLCWMSQLAVLVCVGASPADSSSLNHNHSVNLNVSDDHDRDFVYSEDIQDDYDADYNSDESDEDYETIYDAIRDEIPELLTQVERRYKSHIQHHTNHVPLLSLVAQEPHTMTIMMKPTKMEPETKVRLLYERVPAHRKPNMSHLDRPVMDLIPLIRHRQTYVIDNLPRGKYIVCGEAMDLHDTVFQDSCFETKIHREETEDLQIGVKAIIVISITIVIFVLIYNVAYQLCSGKRGWNNK